MDSDLGCNIYLSLVTTLGRADGWWLSSGTLAFLTLCMCTCMCMCVVHEESMAYMPSRLLCDFSLLSIVKHNYFLSPNPPKMENERNIWFINFRMYQARKGHNLVKFSRTNMSSNLLIFFHPYTHVPTEFDSLLLVAFSLFELVAVLYI